MTRPRGATMIELIVVGSMFLGMLTALWAIYSTTMRVEHNLSLKVDLDREVYAAARHVDTLLKTSRLIQPAAWKDPEPVDTIELQPLLVGADGQPVLNAKGFPNWGPTFTVSFLEGDLVRVSDKTRRLARLGAGGSGTFTRTSHGMLEMQIHLEKIGFRDEKQTRDLKFQFRLFNQ